MMEYTINASCGDCGFEWQSDYKEYMVDDIPMSHYCHNCKNNCDEGCEDCYRRVWVTSNNSLST